MKMVAYFCCNVYAFYFVYYNIVICLAIFTGKIIVYGSSLDAYTSIQSLLALGIDGSRICFVRPPLNYNITCFNNADVETAIHNAMQKEGVELYSGYYLAQWNDGKGGDEVYCASFTSDTKPVKFECSAFLCFNRRAVDYDAFKGMMCLIHLKPQVIDSLTQTFHFSFTSL